MRLRPLIAALPVGAVALLLALWGCGEIARTYGTPVDLDAVRDLVAIRTSALTEAARALSLIGSGYVVFPVALAGAAALAALRRLRLALLIVVGTFGATVIENLDKLLVARPRPPVPHLELVTSYSFPSGHATQSTALYGSLLLAALAIGAGSRALRGAAVVATVLLVAAICWSRLYLGVHYPTDVAAGALLSTLWLALVRRALRLRA